MFNTIKVLGDHGKQYIGNLRKQPVSALFRGRPVISADITTAEILRVSEMCPAKAIDSVTGIVDLGRCVFCKECAFLLPDKILFTNDYRIAANRRDDLLIKPGQDTPLRLSDAAVRKEIRKLFHRALKLRQVSAGGDNSTEMELAASGNVNFDVGRYGIEFVASPRHADGIVITGPVTSNMAEALEICYDAVPDPKIIVLAGADAISGGVMNESKALDRRFTENHNADLYLPGNPVHPLTFINGIMDLLAIK